MWKRVKRILGIWMCFALVSDLSGTIPLLQQAFPVSTEAMAQESQQTAPVLLETKELTASSVRVKWSSSRSFCGVYFILRKSKGTDYSIVGGIRATGKTNYTYTDAEVLAGKTYTYSVAAISEEALEIMNTGERSVYYSQNYGKTTLKWTKPDAGAAKYFLVFADNELMEVTASSVHTVTYTYPYDFSKGTGKPNFRVYALLGGEEAALKSNTMSAKTTLSASKVTKAYLVGNQKARINWTKSKGATGYTLYRRTSRGASWKKVSTVSGENQVYCYDDSVAAKKTYYYAVRAFVKADGGKTCAPYSNEKKAYFKKTSLTIGKGDYKIGSVYGPALSSGQLSQVKAAVQKFCNQYITTDMSNLEKVLAAQLFLSAKCTYAPTWAENGANTAWGVFSVQKFQGVS